MPDCRRPPATLRFPSVRAALMKTHSPDMGDVDNALDVSQQPLTGPARHRVLWCPHAMRASGSASRCVAARLERTKMLDSLAAGHSRPGFAGGRPLTLRG